jgi:peptidoglycan/xylan/chitin deacetylase (PgdA/CDA1 family)
MKFYERAPFNPIVDRPPLVWPNGERLAVWVVPNIEHYDDGVTGGPTMGPVPSNGPPDVYNQSWRDYGLRVGIWRNMEALERLGIRGTVALNSRVCQLYPEVVKACLDLDWEFMGHGRFNTESMAELPTEHAERDIIAETLSVIERSTGRRPLGWLGPGLAESARTPDLLAELGVSYVSDWVNDDQPYWLRTASSHILAMPYSVEINDLGIFLRRGQSSADYERMLRDQFDQLYEDGASAARVMCVSLHPYITGVPYRARALHAALAYMRSRSDVWFTTGAEILAAFERQVPKP